MLCWQSASEWELRLLKSCAGGWTARESDMGAHLTPARAARLPSNLQVPGSHRVKAGGSRHRITMTGERSTGAMPTPNLTLVFYDGVCGLCNRLVAFLLRHDRNDQFRFAPLQSELAQKFLRRYGLDPKDFDTVVVFANFRQPAERALTRSEAAVWAIGRLGGMWRIFAIAQLIPLSVREALYRFIARRRYQIFGRYDACPRPRPEDRHKFLDLV